MGCNSLWAIPITGVSNGMRGGADLILQGNRSLQTAKLTEAWRPALQCRQWSVHCLGDTNTCGTRNGVGSSKFVVVLVELTNTETAELSSVMI